MAEQITRGHAKSAGIVGILILILSLATLICGIVWVTYGGKDAQGIWSGLLFGITGVIGVFTWVKQNKCLMISFMVSCIIDTICCIVATVFAGLAFLIWQILKAIIETKCKIKGGRCDCGNDKVPLELEDCSWISAIEAIFLCLLLINGLLTIVVFAGSIIGCISVCCSSSPQQTAVVVVENPNTTGTVIIQTQQTYPAHSAPPAASGPPPQYSQDASPPGQYPMTQEPIPPKTDEQ